MAHLSRPPFVPDHDHHNDEYNEKSKHYDDGDDANVKIMRWTCLGFIDEECDELELEEIF